MRNIVFRYHVFLIILSCAVLLQAQSANDLKLKPEHEAVLDLLGSQKIKGGLIVHVGCGNGGLISKLYRNDSFLVEGLDTELNNVQIARKIIHQKKIYGGVSVNQFNGRTLPYVDNLVNIVIVEKPGNLNDSEIMRVLVPRGTAYIYRDDKWLKKIKPYPADMDEWTHYLHDASGNAVAADSRVGPPKHINWITDPYWSRSHEFNPSMNALVMGGGRMFYILDEGIQGLPDLRFPARWTLFARDAFNGKFLWKRSIPNWGYRQWKTRGMWSAPLTLNRRVVTDGLHVYVTVGYNAPVTVVDAESGRDIRTIAGTEGTDEIILKDGILLLCVREYLSVASEPENQPKRRRNPFEWTIGEPGPAEITAVDSQTGHALWRTKPFPVSVLTLTSNGDYVCFHGDNKLVCLDIKTGNQCWSVPAQRLRGSRHSSGTLVMKDKVVLFAGGQGLKAYSVKDGRVLWTGPKVYGPGVTHPPDLFVADGLVWGGYMAGTHSKDRTAVKREGLDLMTGQVKRTVEIEHLISPLHHFRCYRSKATDDFLMLTKRGVEFVDLKGDNHMRHDWLRAMCHYGFVPCNGMLYITPHHCFCYPGVKMTGFMALSAYRPGRASAEIKNRLVKGPAYNNKESIKNKPSIQEDWPTYRHDPLRSGYTKDVIPVNVVQAWHNDFGGKVTQAIAADGKLFIAQIDTHQVHCMNSENGKQLWSFTAGGRIDSPPTYYKDKLLFGSRDGWVYCLEPDSGRLCWRFGPSSDNRRIVAFDQLESRRPVPGNVLVLDDIAYVSTGRSSFLDGGIRLYALDPQTGRVLYKTIVEGPWPDVNREIGRPFDMSGTKSDILVTDGSHIFLYQMTFDKKLNDVTSPRNSKLGDRIGGRHLIATGGFLQDQWYDRTYWTYSNRWPGFYYANSAPKSGQILVFDDNNTYGLHVYTSRLRLSPSFTPGGSGYLLFADDNDNEPVLAEKSINREKGPGFSRHAPPLWSIRIPLRALAMVKAGDRLFMAGPPDVVPEDDPYASFEGRKGAQLWVVNTRDGKLLKKHQIKDIPANDGLIAAYGKLYMTTRDGKLICFRKGQ